jgi:hypothetical protein
MKGSVYKRCQCPIERNARGERLACKKAHGSWVFVADAGFNPATGRRRQMRRGGFPTKAAAEEALAEFVDSARTGQLAHDDGQTVAAFLGSGSPTRSATALERLRRSRIASTCGTTSSR